MRAVGVLGLSLSLLALSSPAWGADCVARPGGTSIQACIDQARPGDTITVTGEHRASVSLSNKRGTAEAPIRLVGEPGARIIGQGREVIGGVGAAHWEIRGLHITSNHRAAGPEVPGADHGGIKLMGRWNAPSEGFVIADNHFDGQGQDAVKLFGNVTRSQVTGNSFGGNWRQETVDLFAVRDILVAHNTETERNRVGYGFMFIKAGSTDVTVRDNDLQHGVAAGGFMGAYSGNPPGSWYEGGTHTDYMARRIVIQNNAIADGDIGLYGAQDSRVENNRVRRGIDQRDASYGTRSHSNTVTNNGAGVAVGAVGRTGWNGQVDPITAGPPSSGFPDPFFEPDAQPGPGTVSVPVPDLPPMPEAPPVRPVVTPTVPPPVAPFTPAPPTPFPSRESPMPENADRLGPGFINDIADTFLTHAASWEQTLLAVAMGVFGALALIQIVFAMVPVIRRGDLGDILEVLLWEIITIGFFFWLMVNTADFILAIIDSFAEAGNRATAASGGIGGLGPSDILSAGINMAGAVWNGISIAKPGQSFLLVLVGLITVYVVAKIAAKLIEVLVESVLVAYGGIILMGFGGARATREYAVGMYRYGISVGMKRLFLQLIVGLAQAILMSFAEAVEARSGALSWTEVGIMIGVPLTFLAIADTLPQRAQDAIMGVSTGSNANVTGLAGQIGAGAGAVAAGMAGAPLAAKIAYTMAQEQLQQRNQQAQGGASGSRMGRAAMMAGYTARNLANAVGNDVGQRMSGTGGRFGSMSWRMANTMKRK